MTFDLIPNELKALPQWVVWRIEITETGRPTKIPYTPTTFKHASSTDATTWVPFDMAVNAYNVGGWDGIGFVLSDNDPYTFIDLDDPYATNPDGSPKHLYPEKIAAVQAKVYETFHGTYAEYSPSGTGLHIICKGHTPSGRRRNAVELYSTARFMTMTGRPYFNGPILDKQEAVKWLYDEMGGATQISQYTGSYVDAETDDVVIAKCLNAANGDKVEDLVRGEWQLHYPSQSEADFALINIIAYYTQSRFQIARLFRLSALGQRDKAKRDAYVFGMIDRAFDRMPSQLDMDAISNAIEAEFGAWKSPETVIDNSGASSPAQASEGATSATPPGAVTTESGDAAVTFIPPADDGNNPYLQPVPGLLGQIAYYIYDQAPRPVPEIALAGAIGLMAGICGRSYNVSGTGLNQYTLLLTGTGRGKEAISSGIAKLMSRVQAIDHGGCPAAAEFLGPGEISSGQALIKHFDKVSKSFVSVIGEVDVTLKNMTARNANAALTKYRQVLLASYSASGRNNILPGSIYSDRDKNAAAISSPAFSMIGEGTPERFYNLLDEAMVSDGLLPRFTIIEYSGKRVASNEARMNTQPSPQLVKHTAQLCGQSLMYNQQNRPVDVELDEDATLIMRLFDTEVDALINSSESETIAELWNRAHLKALKLAGLCAVGVNPIKPVINAHIAKWAISIVEHSTKRLVIKFASGDIGSGDMKQLADMKRKVRTYYEKVSREIAERSYGISGKAYDNKAFNYTYIHRTCRNLVEYKNDRMGANHAVRRTVQVLIETGVIRRIEGKDKERFGLDNSSVEHFVLVNSALLN